MKSAAHRREKPREETEARLLRERGTPEERIGPVVPDGTLYPQRESAAHTGFGDCGCDVCCPEPGPSSAAISRERFAARPALTPLEADRVAFLAHRILSASNDSLHAYPKCMGLRACLDDASRIIKLTGRTLTT